MKKVAIDARMINNSGIGTVLQNLIPFLFQAFEVTLLGNETLISKFLIKSDCELIKLSAPVNSIKEQFELHKKIPKCDLFISPNYNIPLMQINASKRAVFIHDVNSLALFNFISHYQRFYSQIMINEAAKKSDALFTVSNFSKMEIIKHTNIDSSKITVANCGINRKLFSKIENKALISSVVEKYKLPENYFLYVGDVKPHKNLISLVKAFKQLIKIHEKFELIIVGSSPTNDNQGIVDQLTNDANLKNKIKFTNYIENNELPVIYQQAFALVFPSLYEGFGLPPLEAMSMGCPVIASDATSIPEVCGNSAIYINPRDVNDILDKMELLINNSNLRSDYINRGFDNINRFSWTDFSNIIINKIERLIKVGNSYWN